MPQPARSSTRNPGTSTRYITTLPPMGVRVTRTASLESINCPLTLLGRFAQSGATGIRRGESARRSDGFPSVGGRLTMCRQSLDPVPCIPAAIRQRNRDRSWADSQILQRVQRPAGRFPVSGEGRSARGGARYEFAPPEDLGLATAVSGATSAPGSPRSDRWVLTQSRHFANEWLRHWHRQAGRCWRPFDGPESPVGLRQVEGKRDTKAQMVEGFCRRRSPPVR